LELSKCFQVSGSACHDRGMTRSRYGTGSIRQTGPARWQIRWSDGVDPFTGKPVHRSATVHGTKTEANRQLAARTAARSRSRITFGQLLDAALPELRVADVTRDTYRHALAHVPDRARQWTAADITATDARILIDGLAERHSGHMVRKVHGAIRSCWREASRSGWVESDPWKDQRLPPVAASAGAVLSADEVASLRHACADDLERCWLHVHLATGARPGEVVGLRWSDIDAAERTLTFRDMKHGGRPRLVTVDETTVSLVTAWQRLQRERALAAGATLDGDPWLFAADERSAVPWRRSYAGGFKWRSLRRRAGIRTDLRLYDLRHTHNSWLAAAGIDEATRGQRIGNTPAVNLRTYSHATRDREAADVVALRLA
jgi:integrase